MAEAKDKASEATEEKKEVPKKFEKLVKEIEGLSTLDLSELVKVLEDHFGVSAAAPAAVAVAPAAGGEAAAEEDQTEFTVTLKDAGGSKINVIKAVREITGQGLAESKAIVDGAPMAVKENVSKEEAEEAKSKLQEAGATVEVE
jgi:large subunit ribosomal protein L7/L12